MMMLIIIITIIIIIVIIITIIIIIIIIIIVIEAVLSHLLSSVLYRGAVPACLSSLPLHKSSLRVGVNLTLTSDAHLLTYYLPPTASLELIFVICMCVCVFKLISILI